MLALKKIISLTIAFLFVLHFCSAQRVAGDVGIGAQMGSPTGLTIKFYDPGTSLDMLAAWDLDDFFFLNLHAIFDSHLNDGGTVHLFYGPGGYIGIRDKIPEDEVEIGISGSLGLDFLIGKFEIFLQATPRLSLVESTDFDMGGGAGFRVYF